MSNSINLEHDLEELRQLAASLKGAQQVLLAEVAQLREQKALGEGSLLAVSNELAVFKRLLSASEKRVETLQIEREKTLVELEQVVPRNTMRSQAEISNMAEAARHALLASEDAMQNLTQL